jgi:protoheme IX farnesyltransferase
MRLKLSCAVAFSAWTGFIYFRQAPSVDSMGLFAGVFLLGAGASALNQVQERGFDARMARTRARPLPNNHLNNHQAMMFAATLVIAGVGILACIGTWTATILAVFNLLWYNAVYTPLKKRSRCAPLMGALTGALPPLIGYTAGGGALIGQCLWIALFLYLWQIAHFMLLLVKYGAEYEQAGFPTLATAISPAHFHRAIYLLLLGTAVGSLLWALVGVISSPAIIVCLFIMNCLFILAIHSGLFGQAQRIDFAASSRVLYPYQGLVLMLLIVDAIFW